MEGTRAVGNVSGLGLMCFTIEKAIERWRRDKSSSRTRHFPWNAEGLGKVGQRKIELHEVCVNLSVGAVQNTMVDVVISRYLDTELLSKSLDSEVGHRW